MEKRESPDFRSAEVGISATWLRPFLSFRYFSIKIDKINRLIAEIDYHKNLTDRFPSIFDINR